MFKEYCMQIRGVTMSTNNEELLEKMNEVERNMDLKLNEIIKLLKELTNNES